MDVPQVSKQIMVIWKEREHDLDEYQSTNHPNMVMALRESWILQYFRVLSMRTHVRLLDHLIRMWDLEKHHFLVSTHFISIDVEDIFFWTRIYRREILVSLSIPWGREMTIDDRIDEHCMIGTRSQGDKIPIKHIMDRTLRTVTFTIEKVVGSRAAHQMTRVHMLYILECMDPTILN